MSIPIFLADNKSSSCQFVNRGTGTCWCLFVYILVVVAVFFSFHFFHCMVFCGTYSAVHRRTGNFLPGGAVNHLPKKISQVAQIFTKESKRNEGHIATT